MRSNLDGRIYTGYTTDLKRRIKEHLAGSVYSSSRMGGLELVYYEAFLDIEDAKRREKYLKTTKGKRAVKLMLKCTIARFV